MLEIHDTSGSEMLVNERAVQYKDADIFIVCVAADLKHSKENVSKWLAEIRNVENDIPIVLMLTKDDLLDEGARNN